MHNATVRFRSPAAAMMLAMGLSMLMMISLGAGATSNHTMTDETTLNIEQPLHAVPFAWSKDTVSRAERRTLRRLAKALDPDHPLLLSGYTDDIGPEPYNRSLAQRRAEAVSQALISFGVPAGLITTVARGEHNPLASNETKEGRAQNRRVEIDYQDRWLRVVGGGQSTDDRRQRRATDPRRVGRYLFLASTPTESQKNPLGTLVRVTFPAPARTIGAALEHLLARSGWRLADPENADPSMGGLIRLPLPENQRSLGPLRLIDAVQVLCGEPFSVVVDPVHRLISCELREPYANHWTSPGGSTEKDEPPGSPAKPEDDDPS